MYQNKKIKNIIETLKLNHNKINDNYYLIKLLMACPRL